jgi:hypothetical protein
MSTMVSELYSALRKAGVDEESAQAAAQAVLSTEVRTDLATKADLTSALAELKADLFRHTTDTLIKVTAIYAGLVLMELAIFAFAAARLLGVSR